MIILLKLCVFGKIKNFHVKYFFRPKISDLDKKCHFSSAIPSVKNNGVTLIFQKWTSCYLKTLISRSSGGVGRTTAALDKLLYMLGVHWNSFWGNRAAGSARTEPWYFFFIKIGLDRVPPYIFHWVVVARIQEYNGGSTAVSVSQRKTHVQSAANGFCEQIYVRFGSFSVTKVNL